MGCTVATRQATGRASSRRPRTAASAGPICSSPPISRRSPARRTASSWACTTGIFDHQPRPKLVRPQPRLSPGHRFDERHHRDPDHGLQRGDRLARRGHIRSRRDRRRVRQRALRHARQLPLGLYRRHPEGDEPLRQRHRQPNSLLLQVGQRRDELVFAGRSRRSPLQPLHPRADGRRWRGSALGWATPQRSPHQRLLLADDHPGELPALGRARPRGLGQVGRRKRRLLRRLRRRLLRLLQWLLETTQRQPDHHCVREHRPRLRGRARGCLPAHDGHPRRPPGQLQRRLQRLPGLADVGADRGWRRSPDPHPGHHRRLHPEQLHPPNPRLLRVVQRRDPGTAGQRRGRRALLFAPPAARGDEAGVRRHRRGFGARGPAGPLDHGDVRPCGSADQSRPGH